MRMKLVDTAHRSRSWDVYLTSDKLSRTCAVVAFDSCNSAAYVRRWVLRNLADLKPGECYWLKPDKVIPMVALLA